MPVRLRQLVSILTITLLHLLSHLTPQCRSSPENTFDFIIVGGGTAGLAVARRLAENGQFTVLVLESGDFPREGSDIPAFAPSFIMNPDVTFRYRSVPQKNAGLRTNGIITVFYGRMLSGTSNLNYMFYNRGSPRDYDNWGNLTNDASWNYSNMLGYFKKAETYRGDYPSDQHGYSGPVTISRPRYAPGLQFWLEAGKSLGYEIADQNGPQRISFTAVEFSKKMGRRVNSLDAYIEPILVTTPNLKIVTNTNATRILFQNNRAVGIRFHSSSAVLRDVPDNCVYARKEIILSAGTYGSPLLLLRSGVGPRYSLQEANIPVVKDLPVGLNFHDHVSLGLPFVLNNNGVIMESDRDLNAANFELYKTVGDGPYSSTGGATGQALVASSVAIAEGDGDWADLHLTMGHSRQSYFATGIVGNDTVNSWEGPMAASVYMNRPKSRGSLRLDPDNPDGTPILDVGYLSDQRDIQKMLDGVDYLLTIFEETPAYKKLGARFPKVNLPQCDVHKFRSRAYWECYVKHMTLTGCHPAGTCRMGRGKEAVVDTELRVIGIDGLRVVDASIMPVVTNANTQAPVYAIAEKASDMILRDWTH